MLIPALALTAVAPIRARARQSGVQGSVSAVGTVLLRGLPVSGDGTLFAGDRIETSGKAYARVRLGDGSQLELGSDTSVRIGRDEAGGTLISMTAGRMALSASASSRAVRVEAESVRIEAPGGAAAEIAFIAPNRLSVRALRETVTVAGQDPDSEPQAESEQEGQVIINLDAGVEAEDTPPDGESASGEDSASAKWVLVGAGAGAAAGTAIFLAGGEKDSASPSQP